LYNYDYFLVPNFVSFDKRTEIMLKRKARGTSNYKSPFVPVNAD